MIQIYDAIILEQLGNGYIGYLLAVLGSAVGSIGAMGNSLGMHREAYILWAISNPLLLIWVIGLGRGWWRNGLSAGCLAIMYAVFIVFNAYALWRFVL